jgi:hypothetical protein
MAIQLTADDARQSLTSHVEAKGREIFEKYGPRIGWKELLLILEDRACVRYPCELVFDSSPLQPGECAYPQPKGNNPEAGFRLCVHPTLLSQLQSVPYVALYQLVLVNYGEFASIQDAEAFGAAALGIPSDDYYATLCELHDGLSEAPGSCGCSHSPHDHP